MCGLLGYSLNYKSSLREKDLIIKAIEDIAYRGPDNTGTWFDKEGSIGLAHKRLSIQDVSAAANQPMSDSIGNYIIIFNGEIYNYKILRESLISKGHAFITNSDTEVLIYGYLEWGDKLFPMINGMFSLAIIDLQNQEIILARDRSGEKPLYYSLQSKSLYFCSEIKPLLHFPEIKKSINMPSLNYLFAYGYCPNDDSIYSNIKKVEAGTLLKFNLTTREIVKNTFFNLKEEIITTKHKNQQLDEKELVTKLEGLLENSIDLELNADVPVGLLLSGGLDSSIIVALGSRLRSKLDTFTVKFNGYSEFDESSHASLISKKFNTNHHLIDASEISPEIIETLVEYYDEPIFDSSIIPTFLVSKAISSNCKVALGGDGGDELFGGYPHYNKLLKYKNYFSPIPLAIRGFLSKNIQSFLPTGYKGKKSLEFFGSDFKNSYPDISEFFSFNERKAILNSSNILISDTESIRNKEIAPLEDFIKRATLFDYENYLKNDLLVKVDRASMANSLEIRCPFLDKEIINFSFFEVPSKLKVQSNRRKILLKMLAKKILPKEFDYERKQGFSIPLKIFLKEKKWYDFFNEKINSSNPDIFNKSEALDLLNSKSRLDQNAERLFALVFFMCWVERYTPSF